jgi:hypothetical protein
MWVVVAEEVPHSLRLPVKGPIRAVVRSSQRNSTGKDAALGSRGPGTDPYHHHHLSALELVARQVAAAVRAEMRFESLPVLLLLRLRTSLGA